MIIYRPVKNTGVVHTMRFVLPASNPRQILEGEYQQIVIYFNSFVVIFLCLHNVIIAKG